MMCLGHKYGTNCKKVVRTYRHVGSWEIYQLCANCSKSDKTVQYRESIDVKYI